MKIVKMNQITPMPFKVAVLFFGAAALLFLLNERFFVPYLIGIGVNKAVCFLTLAAPFVLMFIIALVGYRQEGNPWTWQALLSRFRFKKIKGRFWFWVIGFVIVDTLLYIGVFKAFYPYIKAVHDWFPTPKIIYDLQGSGLEMAGYPLQGNWWLLGMFFFRYFFNVVGEEILWRGYILPRQELQHGKYTWVIHGLLWTSWHLFAPYNALLVLPGALFMSYIVQKYQNNTIFFISHATLNAFPLISIISGIIGNQTTIM